MPRTSHPTKAAQLTDATVPELIQAVRGCMFAADAAVRDANQHLLRMEDLLHELVCRPGANDDRALRRCGVPGCYRPQDKAGVCERCYTLRNRRGPAALMVRKVMQESADASVDKVLNAVESAASETQKVA